MKEGTRAVYNCGLSAFERFYKNSAKVFLDEIEEDYRKPRQERTRVARNTLNNFVNWLKKKGYSAKTIRSYVASVQSFAAYFEVNVSTKYVKIPDSVAESSKFAWNLDSIWKFFCLMDGDLELQSYMVSGFQLGWGCSDVLALNYGDIKYEFENQIVPLCVDTSRIKTGVHSMSFIGEWGVSLLRKHLEGISLSLNTPLYSFSRRTVDAKFQSLAEVFLGEYSGRNPVRPHSLRSAFRTLLSDAGLDRDIIKFFMAQSLPEHDKVYHRRSRDGWRSMYKNFEGALTPKQFKSK